MEKISPGGFKGNEFFSILHFQFTEVLFSCYILFHHEDRF